MASDGVWRSLRIDDFGETANTVDDIAVRESVAFFLLNKFRQLASDLSLSTWMDWVEVK